MHKNGYSWTATASVNSDTVVRLPDPDFLIEYETSATWRRFEITLVFLFGKCLLYFYFRFALLTDLKVLHALTHTVIISAKFEAYIIMHSLPSYGAFAADTLPDLVTLTFDLLTSNSRYTWRVTLSTLPPDSICIRFWLISHNVIHRIPLTLLLWLLRIRRIMWPERSEEILSTYFKSRTQIYLSLWDFRGSTMKVIQLICQNYARPCVTNHINFRACAKSSDLLHLRPFSVTFYCACAETVIYEVPV